jgi:hypothetical protein
MKGTRIQYPEKTNIPAGAVRVRTYADEKGITVSYVYKQYKEGKLKIISVQGINFVLLP